MESSMLPVDGIDMNNEANLALYTQIILFKTSLEEMETLFQDPNPLQQRAIQTWAHSFGCEYEYPLATRTARVVKPVAFDAASGAESQELEFFDFGFFPDLGVAQPDLRSTDRDLGGLNLSHADGIKLLDDLILWPGFQALLEAEDNGIQSSHLDALAESPIAKEIAPDIRQTSTNDVIQSEPEGIAQPIPPSSPYVASKRKSIMARFGRRQSVHSQASSGYQEIVFDSGSSRPSSPDTPGRRGPLDAAARAAMKAVKAVRACWRCKFLRKTCSPDNPCLRCPTNSTSCKEKSWPAVGCKRGSFEEVLAPLHLCPRQDLKDTFFDETFDPKVLPHGTQASVNEEYQTQIETRAETLRKALDTSTESEPTTLVSYIQSLQSLDPGIAISKFSDFQTSSLLPIPSPMRVAFTPLEECIAAVIYEAVHCRIFNLVELGERPLIFPRIVNLLYSAARYQAKIDSDELIAQSIICLRSSFEAIRMTPFSRWNAVDVSNHNLCKADICQIDYIRVLNEHLSLYLNALSKVFFKKENMRVKETWWLSTFYSFAIQGLVRQLIRQLSFTKNSKSATDQYLHLAIRLFIASSGDYDPLTRDYVTLSKDKEVDSSYFSDLDKAKEAVERNSWKSRGVSSSADYLRDLFEDKCGDITIDNKVAQIRDAVPDDQIPFGFLLYGSYPGSTQKEIPGATWSSIYPANARSRPYRPSSLSSMESSSSIGSTQSHTYSGCA